MPDWAATCQFCGTDTKGIQRPVAAQKKATINSSAPTWIWPAYYVLSVWWIISGVGNAVDTIHVATTPIKFLGETFTPGFGFFSILGLIFDVFTVLVGLGLILKVEIARGVVNFFAGLRILFGLLGVAGSLIGALVSGPWGVLLAFMHAIDVVIGALTIFVIGETDTRAPNL